jgi:hypothetical protein
VPAACALLRTTDHYRADVFRAGIARHGFTIEPDWRRRPDPGDVLLLWNRSRAYEAIADIYERAGARVLVAENGYIDRTASNGKFYALALDHHNGAGRWYVGDKPRFEIREQPWRKEGRHVLVLPQRGIGPRGVAMPANWLAHVRKRLEAITDRQLVIRQHPGAAKSDPAEQLAGAHCAVTWGSGAGVKAIRAGIPVFHELGKWIGGCAATRLAGQIESCNTTSRETLWTRISWAQWALDEIASGEAFDQLLHEEAGNLFRAEC